METERPKLNFRGSVNDLWKVHYKIAVKFRILWVNLFDINFVVVALPLNARTHRWINQMEIQLILFKGLSRSINPPINAQRLHYVNR